MYDSLMASLSEKGIAGNFHFAGLIPPDQVCRYLAQADMLWHLSLHEGLPRAVVQALATGIPAIGFALDGTPEVIIDGVSGFLTAPEDIDRVAAASAELLDDPQKAAAMGQAGKKMVLEKFDWRKMSDILEKEYLQLYAGKNTE